MKPPAKALGTFLCLLWLVPVWAAPEFAKLSGRVVDGAGLLSSPMEARISELLATHEQASGNQLVVATVEHLQGYDIATYGYQLARFWGIGQQTSNNGVVLLVAKRSAKSALKWVMVWKGNSPMRLALTSYSPSSYPPLKKPTLKN